VVESHQVCFGCQFLMVTLLPKQRFVRGIKTNIFVVMRPVNHKSGISDYHVA